MLTRLAPALNILSVVVLAFGCLMLVPLVLSLWLQDAATTAYDEAILVTLASGALLWLSTARHRRELKTRDGFLLVVLIWTILPLFGAMPFLFYFSSISFTDAYFEAVSGLTSTGATALSGLDSMPPSINFWRHLMIWLGGMGIIVLMVAVLPMLGVGGRQLFKAEMPGPMKDTKLTPRITETAKALWLIYFALTFVCALAYRLAGMTWLDAVMHAFTTCALGGFSSHDDSMGYFNSPVIEGIAMTFMLLSGINYATHFLALRGVSPAAYLRDPEVKFYLGVLLLSVLMLTLYLWHHGTYPSFWTALRYASFNTISVATTTGYSTTDYYGHWPVFASLWMLFLCSFVSSSGSTGGGIKMMRAIILYKVVYREFIKLLHPHALVHTKLSDLPVPANMLYSVLAFAFIYMCSIATLTLLMVASGQDLITGFSAIVASINNTGPGLHKVGPATTFLVLTDFQTWLCTFAMLLGRLELFALLIVFTPAFWRK